MTDLKQKSEKELLKLVSKNKQALRELRFKSAGSKLKDDKEINRLKKEIARALTVLNN